MTENQEQIERLQAQLDKLVRTQIDFQKEVSAIRNELDRLRAAKSEIPIKPTSSRPIDRPLAAEHAPTVVGPPSTPVPSPVVPRTQPIRVEPPQSVAAPSFGTAGQSKKSAEPQQSGTFSRYISGYTDSARENLEKFIGENLISKIGIIVLILGVGIGAKYAIDNDLISPLTRIIVAYILGLGLIGLAVRLKPKYHNFSAVLISGGMAIVYFVTYFAYSAYSLMNQPAAFSLMVIFTIFTVTAAMIYDRQVIAHIGLVGAYAVPFLLSNNSGNYLILFSYMTVLNGGILAISVRKNWKPLLYTAFGFTWIIYGGWLASKYLPSEHFYLALIFLAVFASIFLCTQVIGSNGANDRVDSNERRDRLVAIGVIVTVFYSCFLGISVGVWTTERSTILLAYLAVSTITILATTLRSCGNVIYAISFAFVWLGFGLWLGNNFSPAAYIYEALVFLTVFGAIFLTPHMAELIPPTVNGDETTERNKRLTAVGAAVSVFYSCYLWIGMMSKDAIWSTTLLVYLAAATLTILILTIRSYGKVVYAISFTFVWLAFGLWMGNSYSAAADLYLALVFIAIFAALFFGFDVIQDVRYEPEEGEDEQIRLAALAAPVVAFFCFFLAVNNISAATGTYALLFTYLSVITLGFIIVSFRYYGKPLVFVCYPFVWLIFGVWMTRWYSPDLHFTLALVFSAVFFSMFYVTVLFIRLRYDELTVKESTAITLTNSFLFYGSTYNIMNSRASLHEYLGLFTSAHGGIHLITANIVGRLRTSAIDIVQMMIVLVLTFATIAVPIQFDGNRITLVWAVEGAFLFWFGRVRRVPTFEYYSYPVMLLAIGGLLVDWGRALGDRLSTVKEFDRVPLMNGDFVTSLVFVAAFFLIFFTNRNDRHEAPVRREWVRLIGGVAATVFILALYNTFRVEIANCFHIQTLAAGIVSPMSSLMEPSLTAGYDIVRLNASWQLVFTMFFLIVVGSINRIKVRSVVVESATLVVSLLTLAIFATFGMYLFSQMRIGYMLHPLESTQFVPMNILIRYVAYVFAAGLLWSIYRSTRTAMMTDRLDRRAMEFGLDAVLYATALVAASCDLVNVMAQFQLPDATKLGLSILWGFFALGMVVIGIAWNKVHLRIAAIVLLAVTLVKLFFYDISELGTIPKTILFVSLGILLLIVSFLYNKYKGLIFRAALDDEHDPLP